MKIYREVKDRGMVGFELSEQDVQEADRVARLNYYRGQLKNASHILGELPKMVVLHQAENAYLGYLRNSKAYNPQEEMGNYTEHGAFMQGLRYVTSNIENFFQKEFVTFQESIDLPTLEEEFVKVSLDKNLLFSEENPEQLTEYELTEAQEELRHKFFIKELSFRNIGREVDKQLEIDVIEEADRLYFDTARIEENFYRNQPYGRKDAFSEAYLTVKEKYKDKNIDNALNDTFTHKEELKEHENEVVIIERKVDELKYSDDGRTCYIKLSDIEMNSCAIALRHQYYRENLEYSGYDDKLIDKIIEEVEYRYQKCGDLTESEALDMVVNDLRNRDDFTLSNTNEEYIDEVDSDILSI